MELYVSYIDWNGKSGSSYRYRFLDNPTAANPAVAGNYAFVKQLAER